MANVLLSFALVLAPAQPSPALAPWLDIDEPLMGAPVALERPSSPIETLDWGELLAPYLLAPAPTTAPAPVYVAPRGALDDAQLAALRRCESGDNYRAATGNGFYGAVQWLRSTWDAAARGAGLLEWVGVRPDQAPAEIQDHLKRWWWAHSNPATQWPHCSRSI